jgi:hypothetical protein
MNVYYFRAMFDWNTYKATGIQAVDMCAAAIFSHRKQSLPLKAIHLWPDMYKQFLGWTEKNLKRELEKDEKMEFDGVFIEMGTRSQSTPLLLEMYTSDRVLTDYDKYLSKKNLRVN